MVIWMSTLRLQAREGMRLGGRGDYDVDLTCGDIGKGRSLYLSIDSTQGAEEVYIRLRRSGAHVAPSA